MDIVARLRPLTLHLALVLSGSAALAYQTTWTRMLHRVFGVGDAAVATVLAAFFLGLGLGSWAASRFGPRALRPARVYALLELAIAAYAAASPWFVPSMGTLYVAVGPEAGEATLYTWRFALAMAVLLPPTVLMGATLPVVVRLGAGHGWARGASGFYVSNTLGAVLGAAVAGLYVVPQYGARVATWWAALASVAAAVLVAAAYRGAGPVHAKTAPVEASDEPVEANDEPAPTSDEPSPAAARPSSGAGSSVALAAALATLTGASALAGEVLWTRVLRTFLHATTQAFAAMLVVYLLGIAAGGLIARRTPSRHAALALGLTQVAAGVLTVVTMTLVPHVVRLIPLFSGQLSFTPHQPGVILAVAALLLFPLALVLGTGLPLAWSMAEQSDPDAARGSGRLLAVNTLGGLFGSLAAGFFLVPAIGLEAALLLVMFVHLVTGGMALRHAVGLRPLRRVLALTAPLGVGVLLVFAGPTLDLAFLTRAPDTPIAAVVEGPGPSWREPLVFVEEGRSTTVTVSRRAGGLRLFNDGRPESGFGSGSVGFGAELALLAGLPVLQAERTERALAIGFGAGHTTSVLLEGGFGRVDVVELEPAIIEAARLMHEARSVPFPLEDPRAHLIVDDGRNQLTLAEPRSYDAVVSQPSHPWLAGSSALYTREFFLEVDRALRDGGVFALWVNLFRIRPRHIQAVVHTLLEVFPHVEGFIAEHSSLILCASRAPLRWDERLDERLERLRGRYLQHHRIGTRAELARVREMDTASARHLARGAPRIEDDRPLLELELAATPANVAVRPADLDRLLAATPWWSGSEDWPSADAFLQRIEHVFARPAALRRVELALEQASLADAERNLVRGALADARGDVRGALAAWDAADHPEAAVRADRLRLAEGMPARALRRAREREALPVSVDPLLEAALLVDAPWASRVALELAERSGAPSALAQFVQAFGSTRCAAWSERREAVERLARGHFAVALVAQQCAFGANDRPAAERLGTLAVRARRANAQMAYERAEQCRGGGNGGCALMLLDRALRDYPSHSASAAVLAQLLHRGGRPERARQVLLDTLREVEGLPESEQRLAATADALGIDIGVAARGPAQSPTSAEPESDQIEQTSN